MELPGIPFLSFLDPTLAQEKLMKTGHNNMFIVSSIVGLVAWIITIVRVAE